ncbi:MAG: biotin--[acetyl-CoA-carboxylase] ligase [Bacteroidales bacterium]|jgi:BirA family biotin operon repressor/biotin-[acetyl-CoA-carboxylase] ligase|nr:biotin--[acetyl-CoA-carboxylase] ligase [Bacteroidales bacterium]
MKYFYRFLTRSTNLLAGKSCATPPFIVYTYRQTGGRGMGTNSWFTGSGKNIALSFVTNPFQIPAEDQFLLNITLSLALRSALQKVIPKQKVFLKWPNDIYVEGKKLGGILFENKISGSEFSRSIMGVGINVNQKEFPSDLPNAISLTNVANRLFSKKKLVHSIGSALENARYKNWSDTKNEYLSHLLFYGVKRNYLYKNTPITGSITDIDKFGRLILKQDDCTTLCCDIKELKF